MIEPAHSSRPSQGIWHSLSRFVLVLIVITGSIPIVYSFLPEVKKRTEQKVRIDELNAAIENQRMILARHQREEKLLKYDPEYVGLIARDRLDLMKEGETIYRFGSGSAKPAQKSRTF